MQRVEQLKQSVMCWLSHPKASYYLAWLSFIESFVFPLPPDLMLIPMCLRALHKAYFYLVIVVVASVLGGICGYLIGYFMVSMVMPFLNHHTHYLALYLKIKNNFAHYGAVYIVAGAVSPVPYKLITLTAGLLNIPFAWFVFYSLMGRVLRFASIVVMLKWGERYRHVFRWLYDWCRFGQWSRWYVMLSLLIIAILCLCSCTTSHQHNFAPVGAAYATKKQVHLAQPGETLLSIAWRYDKEPAELAYYNHLDEYAALKTNQPIWLIATTGKGGTEAGIQAARLRSATSLHGALVTTSKADAVVVATRGIAIPHIVNQQSPPDLVQGRSSQEKHQAKLCWLRPVDGAIISTFDPNRRQKGVNFTGKLGQAVKAARAGRVIYSGSGIQGYGNLIIIRHADAYLTAYALNKKNLVQEGDTVKSGQKVAEMGAVGSQHGVLHFEIRRFGKPLDPKNYLNSC